MKKRFKYLKKTRGITLIALIVTIIVLLILAGVSLSSVFSEKGIFSRAEQAGNKYNEAKAKEVLETILMTTAQYEKRENPKYDQNGFLDELIKKEIPGSEVKGDVAIVGGWGFELDRSVPKIGTPLGEADKLVFPKVTVSTPQLSSDSKTSSFTITASEEQKGIKRIEIWLAGEKIKEFTYNNKTTVNEPYTVNRNGTYIIKAYADIGNSATATVEGIVPAVKFTPNGSTEWKKEHSTTITVEQTGERITEIKYLWKTGENEPQASEFTETCTDNSTITGKGFTGKYHLWVLLKTDNDRTNICGSDEFYFDNEGPDVKYTIKYVNENSFKILINPEDEYSNVVVIKLKKDDVEVENSNNNNLEYQCSASDIESSFECTTIDYLGNETTTEINILNNIYAWKKFNINRTGKWNYSWSSWTNGSNRVCEGTGGQLEEVYKTLILDPKEGPILSDRGRNVSRSTVELEWNEYCYEGPRVNGDTTTITHWRWYNGKWTSTSSTSGSMCYSWQNRTLTATVTWTKNKGDYIGIILGSSSDYKKADENDDGFWYERFTK